MENTDLSVYDSDPTLYLFTSLTAGSSHVITGTARIETILKANKVAYVGVDTATDELARKLWGRRARGKKLPALVKGGSVVADLQELEDWNEFGEVKQNLGVTASAASAPSISASGIAPSTVKPATSSSTTQATSTGSSLPVRQPGVDLLARVTQDAAVSKKADSSAEDAKAQAEERIKAKKPDISRPSEEKTEEEALEDGGALEKGISGGDAAESEPETEDKDADSDDVVETDAQASGAKAGASEVLPNVVKADSTTIRDVEETTAIKEEPREEEKEEKEDEDDEDEDEKGDGGDEDEDEGEDDAEEEKGAEKKVDTPSTTDSGKKDDEDVHEVENAAKPSVSTAEPDTKDAGNESKPVGAGMHKTTAEENDGGASDDESLPDDDEAAESVQSRTESSKEEVEDDGTVKTQAQAAAAEEKAGVSVVD